MDIVMMLVPVLTYIALMFAIRMGKLSNIFLFVVITVATLILGIISISVVRPIDTESGDLRALVINVTVGMYILSFLYGGWGARSGNFERILVGGIAIAFISLISAVM
jgi:heme/copper-type cytochrome/quinol oxidase subunit 2